MKRRASETEDEKGYMPHITSTREEEREKERERGE
jgi:hypothetical protein